MVNKLKKIIYVWQFLSKVQLSFEGLKLYTASKTNVEDFWAKLLLDVKDCSFDVNAINFLPGTLNKSWKKRGSGAGADMITIEFQSESPTFN